jgi:hypothetical protein
MSEQLTQRGMRGRMAGSCPNVNHRFLLHPLDNIALRIH